MDDFIARWEGVKAGELATAQSFVADLCDLLGVAKPVHSDEYMFERPILFSHGDGTTSAGRIDCYKRGHFVLEAKRVKDGAGGKRFDDALLRARSQAENYARALPPTEGRPPFVIVVDVGNVIELYAEFSRSGGTYTPFPDPRSHRIRLRDLRSDVVLNRLRAVWLDPLSLDPARANARVTKQVAIELAEVARSLEARGYSAHDVASFLTRCLFSMFAEDVDLLPKMPNGDGPFSALLQTHKDDPATLEKMLAALWSDMDKGGFSPVLAHDVLRFNGKLFKAAAATYTLPLNKQEIEGLMSAAKASWKEVEPSIFGTLLERALDPAERGSLGAHYTPRAYVERLVLPAVVEPLRREWADAQAAALLLASEADIATNKLREEKLKEARDIIRKFHHRLCTVRVLDPACGSGNFLYVTLEHLKRLEGEILNQLELLGDSQAKLVLEGETVTLQQLRGIELNERAASLAELVLWIGFLQWHIRTYGSASVSEPVIHNYQNIEARDAVLAYDSRVPMRDSAGNPISRWDGVSFKIHPVTGLEVPDESKQIQRWVYLNARKAAWPAADYIVGNPPFIGDKRLRARLGDGYVETLRQIWSEVPDSAEFVMTWWHIAAEKVGRGEARQFGFITTNSIRQIFNRRVVDYHLRHEKHPVHLTFAIPDHPWVDSADGAAVRISMTVAAAGRGDGRLSKVTTELIGDGGEAEVELESETGLIYPDLRLGVNVAGAAVLRANTRIAFRGITLLGEGFWVRKDDPLVLQEPAALRPVRNGKDLTRKSRDLLCIDLFGMTQDDARQKFPGAYQRLMDRVKPERDVSERKSYRERWWTFAEPRPDLRLALKGLQRYIATTMTAKHRIFSMLDASILPDQGIVAIASSDYLILGVLSSRVHTRWAFAAGGTLEDRPRYNQSRCFQTFPFPGADTGMDALAAARIRDLAEQLDKHRRDRIEETPSLSLTSMYNVMQKEAEGIPLSKSEKVVHQKGLLSVLRELHRELDKSVLASYGWSDELDLEGDELLLRLVELNAARASQEADGVVHWIRPEFQVAQAMEPQPGMFRTDELDTGSDDRLESEPRATRLPWPNSLPEQIKAVADFLGSSPSAVSLDQVAARFTGRGRWRERLPTILDTLEALGRARRTTSGTWNSVR